MILAALRGEPTRLSPGEQLRDYLHVADAAAAVWAAAQSGMTGPVNIGSGVPVAIGALAQQIGEILGRPELIRLGDLPYRAGDPMFVCANTGRLKEATGWDAALRPGGGLAGYHRAGGAAVQQRDFPFLVDPGAGAYPDHLGVGCSPRFSRTAGGNAFAACSG